MRLFIGTNILWLMCVVMAWTLRADIELADEGLDKFVLKIKRRTNAQG